MTLVDGKELRAAAVRLNTTVIAEVATLVTWDTHSSDFVVRCRILLGDCLVAGRVHCDTRGHVAINVARRDWDDTGNRGCILGARHNLICCGNGAR